MSSKRRPRKGKLKSKRTSKVKLRPTFAPRAAGETVHSANDAPPEPNQARYRRPGTPPPEPEAASGPREKRGGLSGPAVLGLAAAAIGALFVYSEVHRRACVAGQINPPANCFKSSSSFVQTGRGYSWSNRFSSGSGRGSITRGGFGRGGGGRGGGG